jgi:hypothetical protein
LPVDAPSERQPAKVKAEPLEMAVKEKKDTTRVLISERETESSIQAVSGNGDAPRTQNLSAMAEPASTNLSVSLPLLSSPRAEKSARPARKSGVSRALPGTPSKQVVSIQSSSTRGASVSEERRWTHNRVLRQDVLTIIELSAKRAKQGFGSFRYIQEPDTGYANSSLFSSLESLGCDYLYANIGTCARYGTADLEDFSKMLRSGFTRALSRMSERSRANLVKNVAHCDSFSVFAQNRPGTLDVRASAFIPSLSRSICAFGRKSRPLVLVVRGGERIDKNVHQLFSVLAKDAETNPICVIVFFDRIHFPKWHVLDSIMGSDSDN